QPGWLFVARGPLSAAAGYVRDALARGAAAVIASDAPPADLDLPEHVAWAHPMPGVNVDQPLAGRLAERFFGHPSRRLRLLGVTGTNGKTTTATLIQHLLDAIGVPCGLIGT